MTSPAYTLDGRRRTIVLSAVQEVCTFKSWSLLAAHVRTNHVHIVVDAEVKPELAMNTFKAYASRALDASGLDICTRKRWTRHGSTRYLYTRSEVDSAIGYVVEGQGAAMALFVSSEPGW